MKDREEERRRGRKKKREKREVKMKCEKQRFGCGNEKRKGLSSTLELCANLTDVSARG